MEFLQLEEKLASYGSGGYYLIESFLIKLLQAEANFNKQEFIYNSGNNVATFDAFAPMGFGNIEGPVSIEIVRSLHPNRVIKEASRYAGVAKEGNVTLLIISLTKFGEGIIPFIAKHFPLASQVHIWGPSEIQLLIDRHSEIAANLAKNLFSNRFQVALEGHAEDWQKQLESVVDAVRDQYKSGRFCMFLGAGVSSSAGLPDWDTLLNSLFVSMLTEGRQTQSLLMPNKYQA